MSQQIDKVLTNRFAPGRWHRTLQKRDRIEMQSDFWLKNCKEPLHCGTIVLKDKTFNVSLEKVPATDN